MSLIRVVGHLTLAAESRGATVGEEFAALRARRPILAAAVEEVHAWQRRVSAVNRARVRAKKEIRT